MEKLFDLYDDDSHNNVFSAQNSFTLCLIVSSDTDNTVIAVETKKTDINSSSREQTTLNDLPDIVCVVPVGIKLDSELIFHSLRLGRRAKTISTVYYLVFTLFCFVFLRL